MNAIESTAVLNFTSLDPGRYPSYMSAAEGARLSSFRSHERREQSLWARLVLKYLFLQQMSDPAASIFAVSMLSLNERDLNRFPNWLYREVSLMPGEDSKSPLITWCGSRTNRLRCSLSHQRHCCVASVAEGTRVGVDIESVEERASEFYRGYFTRHEQEWVSLASSNMEPAWLYSVLWSLKECALKAAEGLGAWARIANIHLLQFPEPVLLTRIYASSFFLFSPSCFSVVMESLGECCDFDCELAGHRGQVVAVARQQLNIN
jgi:hypothetical protein